MKKYWKWIVIISFSVLLTIIKELLHVPSYIVTIFTSIGIAFCIVWDLCIKYFGLIVILCIFSSCEAMISPGYNIVNHIEIFKDNLCKYQGKGEFKASFIHTFSIIDTCGKFNIGDTIKLKK